MFDKVKNLLKKRWVWITAAAVLAAVILTVVLILTLGGRNPADGTGESNPADSSQSTLYEGVLGTSNRNLSKSELGQLVAQLYYQAGMKQWGDRYAIVLGGGLVTVRSPGYLAAGEVTYDDLKNLLPSENGLVLCSIKGAELSSRFLDTVASGYYVACGDYGESLKGKVDSLKTYYVVVDAATANNADNKLTVVEPYTAGVYARDLMATHIANGGLGQGRPTDNSVTVPNGGSAAVQGTTNAGNNGGGAIHVTQQGGQNGGSSDNQSGCKRHVDANSDEVCDTCQRSVVVYFDFYGINDLHGKFDDTSEQIGVDELSTYLRNARDTKSNAVFLAAGDMWQGSSESNLTYGQILTDWMNELDFTAMAVGNHDYDWGENHLEANAETAAFPFLAINIYERASNTRVPYCDASVMVDQGEVQIGIIGAIGDCYSSISSDKTEDIYFKVGNELTALVKAESQRLRQAGADFIVYILHDGYGNSRSGFTTASQLKSYYDVALSDGYVDLVFEGHTHQGYVIEDEHGVYHLQNRGDNKGGISHAEVAINSITLQSEVKKAELVSTYAYQSLDDDPLVDKLLNKYSSTISKADKVLGNNGSYRNSDAICAKVAELYYQLGVATWGKDYNIVLGGGFLNTRSPYKLTAGPVKYGDLQMVLPFDNQIVLCSVKGRYLSSKFFNNDNYFIYYGDYGASIKNNIDYNATYYVVVDTYTAQYKYNNLTVVEEYDPTVFARDLLADYIAGGGWS